eukprot:5974042-Pleurochrysis_carterae.AAC.1
MSGRRAHAAPLTADEGATLDGCDSACALAELTGRLLDGEMAPAARAAAGCSCGRRGSKTERRGQAAIWGAQATGRSSCARASKVGS